MVHRPGVSNAFHKRARVAGGLLVFLALSFSSLVGGQDRDRDRDDRNRDHDRVRTLDPGTVIPVRTNESIDVDKGDNRVYTGIVDQDVRNRDDRNQDVRNRDDQNRDDRNQDGRVVIPRDSKVELTVRTSRDNDLILDLESVVVNGQRYGVKADPKRIGSQQDDSLVGGVIGAIKGGQARGRTVRVPQDTVVTFRLQRPLDIGVEDRGRDRDGRHYHDNDRPDRDH
jgi:hypothetical protein